MFVLLAWAGGLALAVSAITIRRVVGVGFTWLATATVALIGVWPALALDRPVLWVAVGSVVMAAATAKPYPTVSSVLLVMAAGGLTIVAVDLGGLPLAGTATAALGGISAEMLLGHWYLIDPTLDRRVLAALAIIGAIGIVLDAIMLVVTFGLPDDGFLIGVLGVLVLTTAGLMAAVLGALRHPAYSGVMAATGLSYLAVLTGLAAVFFGRVLTTGTGSLIS